MRVNSWRAGGRARLDPALLVRIPPNIDSAALSMRGHWADTFAGAVPLCQRRPPVHFAARSMPGTASTQVTEPNGISVPGEPKFETETPLWTFFDE